MKNSKLKSSEYMQNISMSKNFGRFVLTVESTKVCFHWLKDLQTLLQLNMHLKSENNHIFSTLKG